jgi:uncharacterized protein (DUF2235 family)
MPKTIVFCADGTWNGPEEQTGKSITDDNDSAGELTGATLTNVVKLYSNLAGRPTPETLRLNNEQEKKLIDANGNVIQVAKYLHGVGDSQSAVTKVLGGVFGVGVIARVGLLDSSRYDVNNKEEAYKRGLAAWHRSKGITLTGQSGMTVAANRFLDFIETFISRTTLSDEDLIANVPVKCVGVWDTVGSVGVPLCMKDKRYDVFCFADSKLSEKIEFGFHAMAIDEQRADFPVTQWDQRKGVEQVWFVGAQDVDRLTITS